VGVLVALAMAVATPGWLTLTAAAADPVVGVPEILGQLNLAVPRDPQRVAGAAAEPVTFAWQCGDRTYPLAGLELKRSDPPLTLTFPAPRAGAALTLELREFRRVEDGRVAYLVEVNGQRLHFRNRRYEGASPSSAFIDIPPGLAGQGPLSIRLTNRCDTPICFSAAILYDDLEGYSRREGLLQPLYVGPIVDGVLDDQARLAHIRAILPDTAEVKPLFSLCSLAVAHWSPEIVAAKLDRVLAIARDLNMKAEIQAITWWGGTPGGCDGVGGRWNDVTYQQVTYVPSTGEFGLSVPNVWSNTPWLTPGNPRYNAFKADCFARFGRLLRDRYDRDPAAFPVLGIVLDNEPTYWAGGNPGVAADQVADFNPAMVAKARQQGVTLDPQDGLGAAEKAFLRRSLLDYNREMNAGLRRGLGEGALAERVFTHTFMATVNGLFENYLQATDMGVIRDGRLGGEWNACMALLPILEQHRELGIPAGINWELGGAGSIVAEFPIAYAMGCDHLTLFNIADERLAEIAPSLQGGWREIKPSPWRQTLFATDRFRTGEAALGKVFVETQGVVMESWPGQTFGVRAETSGVSGRALMRFRSQELTGRPTFGSLALKYDARAFVFDFKKGGSVDNPDGYLAVRAGTSRDTLTEVDRMFNNSKRAGDSVDLSLVAGNAAEVWVEFEFHAVGLPGWVMLFEVELEQPWADEDLLYTNRSYRADRLRCESSVVGWRADAYWALARATEDAAAWPAGDADRDGLRSAGELFAAGSYRQAYQAVRAIVERRAPPPALPLWAPLSERQERGELGGADAAHVRFNPYDLGYCDAVVKLAPDAIISLEENGARRQPVAPGDLRAGDDVTLEIRQQVAVSVLARRGSASGKVLACTAMTPYAMPLLTLEGQPERALSYAARIALGEAFKGWRVGCQPAQVGDVLNTRWNPETGRIVDLERR
jgi:hypothetical protein